MAGYPHNCHVFQFSHNRFYVSTEHSLTGHVLSVIAIEATPNISANKIEISMHKLFNAVPIDCNAVSH